MQDTTGNIYTPEEAKKLGLEFEDLISLTDQEAKDILELRIKEAEIRRRRKAIYKNP